VREIFIGLCLMKDDGNSTGATVWTGGAGVEGVGVGVGVEGAAVEGAGVEGVSVGVEGAGDETTAASAEPVTLLLIGWKPTALAVTVMVAD
jgi:hypothetical protein